MWTRHDAPQTLQDAQDLVVRKSNFELHPLASAPAGLEPNQIGSLIEVLQQTTARLARLEMATKKAGHRICNTRTENYDPRNDTLAGPAGLA